MLDTLTGASRRRRDFSSGADSGDDFIKFASMVPHSTTLPFDPGAVSTKDLCLHAERKTLTRAVNYRLCQDHYEITE